MFLLRNRQRHLESIRHKEILIQSSKRELDMSMDEDLAKLDKLNKILGNGITLKIYTVTGGRHGH